MSSYLTDIAKIVLLSAAIITALKVIWFLFFTEQYLTRYSSVKAHQLDGQIVLQGKSRWSEQLTTIPVTPAAQNITAVVAYDEKLRRVVLEFWNEDPKPVVKGNSLVYKNAKAVKYNAISVNILKQYKKARTSLQEELTAATGSDNWAKYISMPLWASTVKEEKK